MQLVDFGWGSSLAIAVLIFVVVVPVFIVRRTGGTAGLRDWASVLVAAGLMLARQLRRCEDCRR